MSHFPSLWIKQITKPRHTMTETLCSGRAAPACPGGRRASPQPETCLLQPQQWGCGQSLTLSAGSGQQDGWGGGRVVGAVGSRAVSPAAGSAGRDRLWLRRHRVFCSSWVPPAPSPQGVSTLCRGMERAGPGQGRTFTSSYFSPPSGGGFVG